MTEFKKHFDVLEKETGAPGPDEYWKGKQPKTRNRYERMSEFLKSK